MAAAPGRLGIVDIGSNSIRLVVYDRQARAPLALVNRKAAIGLGTDVERHGRFAAPLFRRALEAVSALVATARATQVAELALLATAAVRNAANGADFCRAVQARTGATVTVLTGSEEARLAAAGVASAFPGASGVVGDLGGGSLELVALDKGEAVERSSLDIGPLRLAERHGGRLDAAGRAIDAALADIAWLKAWRRRPFYAVGGAWRAVARLHMAHHDYPLRIVHGYRLSRRRARDFTAMLEQLGPGSVARIRAVSARRAEMLPWGALALGRLLHALKPAEVIFSAQGLREGFHLGRLDAATRAQPPLLAACQALAGRRRLRDAAPALEAWLAPIARRLACRRLVGAACILADMGWGEHPEYRAPLALQRTLFMPWPVPDHRQRAFLALALFVRYGGQASGGEAAPARCLLDEDEANEAKALGKALRLAFELCAGQGGALATFPLAEHGIALRLTVDPAATVAAFDKLERYAASLARVLGRPVELRRSRARQAPGAV